MDNYILKLQELNGLVVKFEGEFYQLMINEEYDVSFELFFSDGFADAETAKSILDYVFESKK